MRPAFLSYALECGPSAQWEEPATAGSAKLTCSGSYTIPFKNGNFLVVIIQPSLLDFVVQEGLSSTYLRFSTKAL